MITMTSEALRGLPQCPRCKRANPTLTKVYGPHKLQVVENGTISNVWVSTFQCTSCHRAMLAETPKAAFSDMGREVPVQHVFPEAQTVHADIPDRPRQFLSDALASLSAPTSSIMASASAIDAMLKERGIGRKDEAGKERSLAKRIKDAVDAGVLTKEMSEWADKVRLDANDQRHADEDAPLPTGEGARNVFELAEALAEILFVIPAKLKKADPDQGPEPTGIIA